MRRIVGTAALVFISCFVAPGTQAELVYQPPPPLSGSELDQSWREAGAALFNGIAAFNEALAQLELRRSDGASQKFSQAEGILREAYDRYLRLTKAISKPRVVATNKLSDQERADMQGVERAYEIKAPLNEVEAAQLAASETRRLLDHFEKQRPKILRPDLEAVRVALFEVHRLQRIGTQTAITMRTVQPGVAR